MEQISGPDMKSCIGNTGRFINDLCQLVCDGEVMAVSALSFLSGLTTLCDEH